MRISEIFFSLQGEGIQLGLPTVFIRCFGCDLRCSWCDTMYAVEGTDFVNLSVDEVFAELKKYGCKRICLTGGEPLLQSEELIILMKLLLEDDYHIVLETSGHRLPPDIFWNENCVISMDCKCPSSKMQDRMDFTLFRKLRSQDQLKFVLSDETDYDYAVEVIRSNNIKANIIFQPVYGSDMGKLADKVLKDRLVNVRTMPQLHKLIWGDKRGV